MHACMHAAVRTHSPCACTQARTGCCLPQPHLAQGARHKGSITADDEPVELPQRAAVQAVMEVVHVAVQAVHVAVQRLHMPGPVCKTQQAAAASRAG